MDLAALNTAPEVSEYMARHVGALLDELSQHEYSPDRYAALVREREGWKMDGGSDDDDGDEEEI
jgi:hypothetical protein